MAFNSHTTLVIYFDQETLTNKVYPLAKQLAVCVGLIDIIGAGRSNFQVQKKKKSVHLLGLLQPLIAL